VAEGCECKIIGKDTCAFPDLVKQPPFQITGMAPSIPFNPPGGPVILCSYFQWLKGHDMSALTSKYKDESLKAVKRMVDEANGYASGNAGVRADWMWAFTPTPFPRTPPPAGCTAGRVPANPYSGLTLPYSALAHDGKETVQCPEGYKGSMEVSCKWGMTSSGCSTNWVEGDGKVSCCLAGCQPKWWVVYPYTGSKVLVPKMDHDTRSTVQCPKPNQAVPAGFSGTVEYGCANGNLEYLSGQCHPNCKPMLYNAYVWTNAMVTTPTIPHGNWSVVDCPTDYSGKLAFFCHEGEAHMVSGQCFADCQPSKWVVNIFTRAMVTHPLIKHGGFDTVECPDKYMGTVGFACNNGKVLSSGACLLKPTTPAPTTTAGPTTTTVLTTTTTIVPLSVVCVV
jgi:hypothetical protein